MTERDKKNVAITHAISDKFKEEKLELRDVLVVLVALLNAMHHEYTLPEKFIKSLPDFITEDYSRYRD